MELFFTVYFNYQKKINQRQDILKRIIKKKKKAFFAVEGISIKNINDLKTH